MVYGITDLVGFASHLLSESGCPSFLIPMLHRGLKDFQDWGRDT